MTVGVIKRVFLLRELYWRVPGVNALAFGQADAGRGQAAASAISSASALL